MSAKTRQRNEYMGASSAGTHIKASLILTAASVYCVINLQNSKMKVILVLVAIVAAALAAPQQNPKDAVIVKYVNDNIGVDGYNYAYETSDGTSAQEQGQLQNAGTENESISVRGSFSFVGLDGITYKVDYIADENGFQPQGAHLPQAP